MTSAEVIEAYRRALTDAGETIQIRRFTGTGADRPFADTPTLGRIVGYQPHEIVGLIQQGDQKLIVFAQDLTDAGFEHPILKTDRAIVRGKELAIQGPDDNTRRVGPTLVAYELQVRG